MGVKTFDQKSSKVKPRGSATDSSSGVALRAIKSASFNASAVNMPIAAGGNR